MNAVRRLGRAGMAIVAAASVAGCFSSRASLLGARESLPLFGGQGAALRVEFGPADAPVRVTFFWRGDGYVLDDPREPRSRALYRIAPISGPWLMTERSDHGVAVYGLARREGDRLWTFSPACQDLSDADRAALGLTIQPDGVCWLNTPAQLKTALRRSAGRNLQPDGYFQLIAR